MKLTKMTRRSLAMLLAMMMVFSLAVPAFADTGIADDTAISEEDINHNEEVIEDTADDDAINTENDSDVEEHVHNFTILVGTTADCEKAGESTYACECGEEMTKEAEAFGHDFIIDPNGGSSEPTCETDGVYAYTCTRCGQPKIEPIDKLGHDWDEGVVVEPTCMSQGYTEYTCLREGCGMKEQHAFTENTNAHVYSEAVVTEPTCETAGVKALVCTVCGDTQTEEIPALGHSYAEYDYSVEGSVYPTCTEPGCAFSVCTRCNIASAVNPPALGHTHAEGAEGVVTVPTCSMQGYTTYTCDRCGETYQDDFTDMISHVRDESIPGTVITPAAIGVTGTIGYTCKNCGMMFTDVIPALRPSTGGGGGGSAAPAPVVIDEPDVPLASAMPFDDVKENDWYYEAVKYVYDNDLMSGTDTNVFAPKSGTTRGMIVTILHRLENKPEVTAAADFSDVADSKWYSDAISWAAENEIVTGYEDGSFRPDKDITRQELAAILYRYAEYKEYDVTGRTDLSVYSDADSVASYFKDAVEWSVNADLINGMEDGTLAPANGATRAQLASILMRFDKSFTAHESDAE